MNIVWIWNKPFKQFNLLSQLVFYAAYLLLLTFSGKYFQGDPSRKKKLVIFFSSFLASPLCDLLLVAIYVYILILLNWRLQISWKALFHNMS